MQLQLNFGGFYESIWDNILDVESESIIDGYDLSDIQINEYENSIDWGASKINLSKAIVDLFNHLILADEGRIDNPIKLVFKNLNSPRFYNFETDVIILEDFDNLDLLKHRLESVLHEYNAYDDYIELLESAVTPVSGYIPFYTMESIPEWQNINVMIETIFFNDELRMWLDSRVSESGEYLVFDYDLQETWGERDYDY